MKTVGLPGNVCTFKTTRFAKRATRTEVEHIVPVHAFGQSFKAWRDGDIACVDRKGKRYRGRRCSTKVVPLFRKMSSDLYNLRPVVGALNLTAIELQDGRGRGEARGFGSCDVEIGAGVLGRLTTSGRCCAHVSLYGCCIPRTRYSRSKAA